MTARFTHAEIARAAKVATEAGVSVTLETPDGRSDELIQSVTGHQTRAMVAKYAGAARQKARAKEAQGRRE